jgi:aspartate beta-hydroxylase
MEQSERQNAETLKAAADRAMVGGDPATARGLLRQAVALAPQRLDLWLGLAACERALGDQNAALGAAEAALKVDPRSFPALLMRASLLERMGAPHGAGAAYGVALTQAPPDAQMPSAMRSATAHAREVHARYEQALAETLRGGLGARAGPVGRRLEAFIDRLAGRRRVYHSEPIQFTYPGLPEIEFWDREEFPWLADLEAATNDIQAELAGVLAEDEAGLEPYVKYPDGIPLDQWAELNRSPRWSAYHLWSGGRQVADHCRRCPKTMAAVGLIPTPQVQGRSPAAMFSVLKPRTRIPPHTGVANTRLVLHLPLVVPEGCGFRVGAETRPWKVGEAWVFDDTIEHEAWNDSDSLRTILICDVWNPRLSDEERDLIAQVMAAMDAFSGEEPRQDGV